MPNAGIGSFFPSPEAESLATPTEQSGRAWPPNGWVLYNSGRAAIRAIVDRHHHAHPRGCLWVPSYYCWDVTRYVSNEFAVRAYPCRPTEHRLPDTVDTDDLLLVVSYFGAEPPAPCVPLQQVILDTTHDPTAEWIGRYGAGWVAGSLRKTLPLPEGGYAYAHDVGISQLADPDKQAESRFEVRRGSAAMVHKSRWIAGDGSTEKAVWYEALQDHEAAIGNLRPASMQPETLSLLRSMPVSRWRNVRLRNLRRLLDGLGSRLAVSILPSTYGLPLVLPSPEVTDAIHRDLVRQSIYPARIWPQPGDGPGQDLHLADRMLLIHTDHRYSEADMDEISQALGSAVAREGQH